MKKLNMSKASRTNFLTYGMVIIAAHLSRSEADAAGSKCPAGRAEHLTPHGVVVHIAQPRGGVSVGVYRG